MTHGVGLLDRSDCVRLDVAGPDRAKFLHNLTTNDVKRLASGRGCEAFVTSPQGKTLGYVSLLAGDDLILVRTNPGGLELALPHLQKYGVFDDVALADVSERSFEFHLAGPRAEELFLLAGGELPAEGELDHRGTRLADCPIRVVRERPTGRPGLTLIGAVADAPRVAALLHEQGSPIGLVDVDPGTADVLRIEAGMPLFGGDVTADNLPQEVGRDGRAINFVKGCYLGQETVARIDALGHVNKVLTGLKLPVGPIPPVGATLEVDGKAAGKITSAAFSPGWGRGLALAFVRTSHAADGTEVRVVGDGSSASAVVSDLPMLPPSRG
ncbi:MAG: glycine cleavage T C-terminal barrel domain-containing protein [Singulisphaera sp.]